MVVVTSHLPKPGTDAAFFLYEIADDLFDVVATMDDLRGGHRLGRYLNDADRPGPFDAPWRHHGDQQLRLFPSGSGEVS